jgi:hypothetical protein
LARPFPRPSCDTSLSIASGFTFVAAAGSSIELIQGHDGSDSIDASALTSTVTIVGHAGNDRIILGSGDDGAFGFDGDATSLADSRHRAFR